ncbi:MAG: METTL5 family protein [Thermoplasmatota archaeon]
MKQRDLERLLQRIPPHPKPRADLEQIATPAPIAADLLYRALALGDVVGKRVLDLGCGTGVFALGALALGAAHATGVDVDAASLAVAREASRAFPFAGRAEFIAQEVRGERVGDFDVVFQNPPFGAQKPGADRPFLDSAFASAPVVYTMHLTKTGEFVLARAKERGATLTNAWDYAFPIPHLFRHHAKASADVEVTAFRFARAR